MKKRKILLLVLFLVMFVGATTGAIVLARWNKPLGPSLDLPTYTPTMIGANPSETPVGVGTIVPAEITATLNPGTQAAITSTPPTSTPSPTPTRQPLCGGAPTMTILAIGSDQRGEGYMYGLADSIHIVHIDFTVPKVMVIDFPRDLWVEIPDISDHYGITHGKLNQAYLFGNPGMGYYDGPGEGPGLMARTLDYNFGLRVDHYLAIDTSTFVNVIDAVGGIDVIVDTPIDLSYGIRDPGPEYFLSVGTHHLDGARAYILATNRIPSTFQRMKYQKIILSALREKLISPELLPKVPQLVAQFITSVQTDFSLNQINDLICLMPLVQSENIIADSFPREMFTANATFDQYRNLTTFTYSADFNLLREKVALFMNGIWPFP